MALGSLQHAEEEAARAEQQLASLEASAGAFAEAQQETLALQQVCVPPAHRQCC